MLGGSGDLGAEPEAPEAPPTCGEGLGRGLPSFPCPRQNPRPRKLSPAGLLSSLRPNAGMRGARVACPNGILGFGFGSLARAPPAWGLPPSGRRADPGSWIVHTAPDGSSCSAWPLPSPSLQGRPGQRPGPERRCGPASYPFRRERRGVRVLVRPATRFGPAPPDITASRRTGLRHPGPSVLAEGGTSMARARKAGIKWGWISA